MFEQRTARCRTRERRLTRRLFVSRKRSFFFFIAIKRARGPLYDRIEQTRETDL